MAGAGEILVRTMDLMAGKIRPGVTTAELDEAAEKFIRSQGATRPSRATAGSPARSAPRPTTWSSTGSPAVHALRGDVISVDIGVVFDGWVADAARTFPVGEVTPVAAKLLEVTGDRCSTRSTSAAPATGSATSRRRPGARRGQRLLHRPLARRPRHRPLDARGAPDPQLRPAGQGRPARGGHGPRRRADGHRGRHMVRMGDDGWAIYSQDGSLAAHFEFTIAITADGPAHPHAVARERAPAPQPRPDAPPHFARAARHRAASLFSGPGAGAGRTATPGRRGRA